MTHPSVTDPVLGGGYRHDALMYTGTADFLDATLGFITDAIAGSEPILVVVDEDKIDALKHELGADANSVDFADMTDVGANPGRIIGAWHEYLAAHAHAGAIRGIGEPIYPSRSADELAECQLHESLLNIAFPDSIDFWLLCPYDLISLPDVVLAEALRSHPYIVNGNDRRSSSNYRRPDAHLAFAGDLAPAPAHAITMSVAVRDLAHLRQVTVAITTRMRFHGPQIDEMVISVNELATNAIEHSAGDATIRLWDDGDDFCFEVANPGPFTEPLAGRIPPAKTRPDGRGLWIVNQLCDLVQIRSNPSGTVVRARSRRVGAVGAQR